MREGHRVVWNTPQGETEGKVIDKLTRPARVRNPGQKGAKVNASEDDPRYVVESERSGKLAAHKPAALRER
jgi:Hypervirulence associated proteins TUDOR domain